MVIGRAIVGIGFGNSGSNVPTFVKQIIANWLADDADVVIKPKEMAGIISDLGTLDCGTCKAKHILEAWDTDSATIVIRRVEMADIINNL